MLATTSFLKITLFTRSSSFSRQNPRPRPYFHPNYPNLFHELLYHLSNPSPDFSCLRILLIYFWVPETFVRSKEDSHGNARQNWEISFSKFFIVETNCKRTVNGLRIEVLLTIQTLFTAYMHIGFDNKEKENEKICTGDR